MNFVKERFEGIKDDKKEKKFLKMYDIIITKQGRIFVQPYDKTIDLFIKKFKFIQKKKISPFCG